jgi:hypothetical protein
MVSLWYRKGDLMINTIVFNGKITYITKKHPGHNEIGLMFLNSVKQKGFIKVRTDKGFNTSFYTVGDLIFVQGTFDVDQKNNEYFIKAFLVYPMSTVKNTKKAFDDFKKEELFQIDGFDGGGYHE